MSRSPYISALVCIGLLALVGIAYWPGLTGPFLFDDYPNIVDNPILQIERLDPASLYQAARAYVPGHIGRPVATVGLALDWLAWGKNPWGYKLHSLGVHLLNTLLVFALVRRVLSLAWPVPATAAATKPVWSPHAWAAVALALAWAAHPLQVSTVLYVVQRMEMLCHTFVFLGLLAYLRGRVNQVAGRGGSGWLALSALAGVVGMFAKESAVLLPAYTLALELTVLRFAAAKPATSKRLCWGYGVATALGLGVFLAVVLPAQLEPAAFAFRDFGPLERVLTQFRVLAIYIGQILLPLPRNMLFYYDHLAPSRSLLDPPTTAFGALLVAGLLALAFRFRRTVPLAALGIMWFFAAHSITSNVIALEMVFEHRNYFALLGVLLVLAEIVHRIPGPSPQTAKALGVGAIVAALWFLCLLRAATWGNELHLLTGLVSANPGSSRASNDLATLWIGMSDGHPGSPFFDWGMREFERGSRLPGASPIAEQGLILSAAFTGVEVKDEWWDRMQHKLETQPIDPQSAAAVLGLLKQRNQGVEMDDARLARAYTTLADRSGQLASTYASMGEHALDRLGDQALAKMMFLRAIDRCIGNPTYAQQIVDALRERGHGALAESAHARAVARGILLE